MIFNNHSVCRPKFTEKATFYRTENGSNAAEKYSSKVSISRPCPKTIRQENANASELIFLAYQLRHNASLNIGAIYFIGTNR